MGEPPPSDNLWVGDLPDDIDKDLLTSVFSAYGSVVDCRVLPPKNPGQKPCGMVRLDNIEEATWIVDNLNGNIPAGLNDPIVVRFANPPGAGKGWASTAVAAASRAGAPGGKGPYGGKGAARSPSTWVSHSAKGKDGDGKGGDAYGGGKGGGKVASAQSLYRSVKQAGILGGGQVPNECQVYVKGLPPDMTDLDLYKLFAPFGAIAPSGVKAMTAEDGSCKGIGFVDFVDESHATLAVSSLNGFACPDGGVIYCSQKTSGKGGKGGKKGEDGGK